MDHKFTKAQSEPVLTSDGRPWCLNCIICNKQIDMLRDPNGERWLHIDKYIRHKKCHPKPIK